MSVCTHTQTITYTRDDFDGKNAKCWTRDLNCHRDFVKRYLSLAIKFVIFLCVQRRHFVQKKRVQFFPPLMHNVVAVNILRATKDKKLLGLVKQMMGRSKEL